jgi:hypothetical protein
MVVGLTKGPRKSDILSGRSSEKHDILKIKVAQPERKRDMPIGNAVQRGSTVYVYDEKGRQIFTQLAGSGPKDGLQGYTGGTVNIRRGSTIYTYDEKGRQISTTYAR